MTNSSKWWWSAFVAIMAISYCTDKQPEKSVAKPTKPASTDPKIIPTSYQGRWASDGDCHDIYSTVKIDSDDIKFESLSFVADKIISRNNRAITVKGTNIIVADSWGESGYQDDSVRLNVSENGDTLWMNDSPFQKCQGT